MPAACSTDLRKRKRAAANKLWRIALNGNPVCESHLSSLFASFCQGTTYNCTVVSIPGSTAAQLNSINYLNLAVGFYDQHPAFQSDV